VKKTHPLFHLAMAANVFIAMMGENWSAAVAWSCCWLLLVGFDYKLGQLMKKIAIADLFIGAHNCKWPNEAAKEAAAQRLAEIEKQ
jgi:hypothetical protein